MSRPTAFKVNFSKSHSDLPFAKADLVQLCRIGDEYAVTFHQLDYQQAAEAIGVAAKGGETAPVDVASRIVSRVVLNREGFVRLQAAIDELNKQERVDG